MDIRQFYQFLQLKDIFHNLFLHFKKLLRKCKLKYQLETIYYWNVTFVKINRILLLYKKVLVKRSKKYIFCFIENLLVFKNIREYVKIFVKRKISIILCI